MKQTEQKELLKVENLQTVFGKGKNVVNSKDNNTAILIEISSAEKGGNENKGNTTIETKLSSNGMPSLINHIGLSTKKWFGKMFN